MSEKNPGLILIHCDEDGDKSIRFLTEEKFLKEMNAGDFEGVAFAAPGEEIQMDYWAGYILIRGQVIQPKPVEKVKKWAL